jgi:hypothetical protein
MKHVAPLVIATAIAVGVALSPAFLPSQFVRPSREDALDIIETAADYSLSVQNAETSGQAVPLMPDAAKPSHIKFVETKPCGAVKASEECAVIDVHLGEATGRLLEKSWHDATVNLERYADLTHENPIPKTIDIRRLQSPSAAKIARLQIAASRQNIDLIAPSGLAIADVRKRISLHRDMPAHHMRIYSAPWVTGDIAFIEVGLICGDLCGRGENYALRKTDGRWRVIAVQPSWVS